MKTVQERWEQGVPHDPRSKEIAKSIAEIDFEQCSDSFDFKFGGDGDNGETLLYLLDVHFECRDAFFNGPEEEQLRVVAAAILDENGEVHTLPAPARHHDVIRMMSDEGLRVMGPDIEQGFLLSDGRFCRRKAAKYVARKAR